MTLNIVLVTPTSIHLSADFRLSRLQRGGSEKWLPISNNSAKIVTVQYWSWAGLISYCGIGMWNSKHTYQWLAGWLTHNLGEQRTFEDVVSIVQSKGPDWLRDIARAEGKIHRHTFVVAGFANNRSKLALVSNYENLGIPSSQVPSSDLVVNLSCPLQTLNGE